MRVITDNEFDEHFTMVQNHIDNNAAFDGHIFETYGPEIEHILKMQKEHPQRLWTIIDGEGSSVIYQSGYHIVNRIGHFITEEEWDEELIVEEN